MGSDEVTQFKEAKMLSVSFGFGPRGSESDTRNILTERTHSLPSGTRKADCIGPFGLGRHELPRKPNACEDHHKTLTWPRNITPWNREYDVPSDILGILVRSIPDHASSPLK